MSGCIPEVSVLFGQSGWIRQKWLSSYKICFIRAKLLYLWKTGCIRSKVVVIGQKWLYSVKNCCIRAKMVVLGKSGCVSAKDVVFWMSGCIRAKAVVFELKWLYSGKVVVLGQR